MEYLDRCIMCGQTRTESLYTTTDRMFGVRGTFTTVRCEGCGLIFLNPRPCGESLKAYYPEVTYYSYSPGVNSTKGSKFSIKPYLKRKAYGRDPAGRMIRKILEWNGNSIWSAAASRLSAAKVLDIGCGAGDHLLIFKRFGWLTAGAEISQRACKTGNELGLNIRCGTLENAGFPSNSFDFVLLNHTLEHLPNPLKSLLEVKRILKPNGTVMVCLPNHASIQAKLFHKFYWQIDSPRHLFSFTPKSFQEMAKKAKMRIKAFRTNSKGRGMLWSLQYYMNEYLRRNRPKFLLGYASDKLVYSSWDLISWLPCQMIDLAGWGDNMCFFLEKSE
jgi:SAM-dependent methyltransferase